MAKKKTNKSKSTTKKKPAKKDTKDLVKQEYTDEEKARLARETFKAAGIEEVVELIVGDAREYLHNYKDISFCFLDADKEVYHDCYEKIVPNLVKGGLLVADNAITHKEVLTPMLDRALNDERVDALVVPIGSGVLVCRK